MKYLPYGRQSIDENDVAAVLDALKSDYLTTGPEVDRLEEALSEQFDGAHVAVCANGTAALHLAVLAAGIGPGDRVVVPAITFVATANAVRYCGGEVIFADVDPETGLLTARTLEDALHRADGPVRAVMPVHYAGQMAPMADIAAIARRHGIAVIEDACHAIGSRANDGDAGSCRHALASVFSFHPVKTVTAGEGGAVATRDAGLAERIRRLRNHGLVREPDHFVDEPAARSANGETNGWYYELQELGLNYRLPDINCALVRSQLSRLGAFMRTRAERVEQYHRLLAGLEPALALLRRLPGQQPCWHLQVALIDFERLGLDRHAVMSDLRRQGIGTQVHYIPVHRQPYYRARYGDLDLPGADRFYRRALSLPLFPAMTASDVDRVAASLRQVLGC